MPNERIAHLFTHVLPAVLEARRGVAGRIAVVVEGAGAWTIDLGAGVVDAEADLDAECTAVFTLDGFSALLEGERNPLKTRPVALVGDARLIERLGALLLPVQRGGVAARIAARLPAPPQPHPAA